MRDAARPQPGLCSWRKADGGAARWANGFGAIQRGTSPLAEGSSKAYRAPRKDRIGLAARRQRLARPADVNALGVLAAGARYQRYLPDLKCRVQMPKPFSRLALEMRRAD
jgi:hypothetical protein